MREDLRAAYSERTDLLGDLAAALDRETREALKDVAHMDRISFRVKNVDSFVEKALDADTDPPYGDPLVEIEDQVAGRVIVFFLQDLEPVMQRLKGTYNAVERAHRRPAKDEEFGYESYHLICTIPPHVKPAGWNEGDRLPNTFEFQVRTLFMHAWAEPQHDLAYKGSKDLRPDIRRELSWVAASAWGADQAYARVWTQQLGSNTHKDH